MKIRPIVSINPLSVKTAEKIGFKFTDYRLVKNKEGWLILYVSWTVNDDVFWKFKYATDSGSSSGCFSVKDDKAVGDTLTQLLEFNYPVTYKMGNDKYKTKFEIEVGIYTKRGLIRSHSLSHVKNHKHESVVYFAPRGFGLKEEVIDSYRDGDYFDKINLGGDH